MSARGHPGRAYVVTDEQWAVARGWWLANDSTASIARRLGVTPQAVDHHAKRYWPRAVAPETAGTPRAGAE